MDDRADGLTLLPPGRAVTLTGEEHHQQVLAGYLPSGERSRDVVVALGWCRIARGRHAGQRAVEARLGGRRIGELTHRMSERYAPYLDDVLRRGGRPGCAAVLRAEDRGLQVELRLPAVDQAAAAQPGRPAAPAPGTGGAATPGTGGPGARPAPTGPWTAPAAPAATRTGTPTGEHTTRTGTPTGEHTTRTGTPTGAHTTRVGPPAAPYPEVGAVAHPLDTTVRSRRRWPGWAAAGIVTLIVVAGIADRGDEPPAGLPSAASRPATAAPAMPTATPAVPTTAPAGTAAGPAAPTTAPARPTADPASVPATTRQSTPKATTARPAAPPPTTAAPRTSARPAPPAGGGCDPNYSGCVPIASDVDCAGGSGNGPKYVSGPVRVVGTDVYGLDADGNGIGCE